MQIWWILLDILCSIHFLQIHHIYLQTGVKHKRYAYHSECLTPRFHFRMHTATQSITFPQTLSILPWEIHTGLTQFIHARHRGVQYRSMQHARVHMHARTQTRAKQKQWWIHSINPKRLSSDIWPTYLQSNASNYFLVLQNQTKRQRNFFPYVGYTMLPSFSLHDVEWERLPASRVYQLTNTNVLCVGTRFTVIFYTTGSCCQRWSQKTINTSHLVLQMLKPRQLRSSLLFLPHDFNLFKIRTIQAQSKSC